MGEQRDTTGQAVEKGQAQERSWGRGFTRRELVYSCGVGLAATALGLGLAQSRLLPAADERADASRLYDYVYKDDSLSSLVDFVLANKSPNGYLCFGSSEFYISKKLVAQCPQAVFGESACDVDMTYVGYAYCQSLWQAIAAGAYGAAQDKDKCAIFVSPQWFFRKGGDEAKFPSVFSYELLRRFFANPMLSSDVRDYVALRAKVLGIDEGLVSAARRATPLDAINDELYHVKEELKLRGKIGKFVSQAPKKSLTRQVGTPVAEPDWDSLLAAADADGAAACTTNNYGIYDKYWQKYSGYMTERNQVFDEAEPEYNDLTYFLEICRECGMQPLVIMLPMHGAWYDRLDVTSDKRRVFYDRVRKIADDAGATYADFSSCEYERYFLCDTTHPGWRGWVRIESAFYHFVHGQDDDFLGGWNYASTTGTGLDTLRDVAGEDGASDQGGDSGSQGLAGQTTEEA